PAQPTPPPRPHAPPARERLVGGHLRQPGGDAAADDLREDRDDREDGPEDEEGDVPEGQRKIHPEPERDEEDRRENRAEISGALREVLAERRAGEQRPGEECADD